LPAPPTLLGDAQLSDYRAYEGRKLKKLRYYSTPAQWQPEQQDERVDPRFQTLDQASLYESSRAAGMGLFPHFVLSIPRMGNVIQQNLYQYFDHIPGLDQLLEHVHKYVEDWVRVFYATLYVGPKRDYIQFMFQGTPVRLYRRKWLSSSDLTCLSVASTPTSTETRSHLVARRMSGLH